MAVLDILPGITVTVNVNGVPLKEYRDSTDEEAENKVSQYIKAVSGQKFEVIMKIKKATKIKGKVVVLRVFIDGKDVGETYCVKSQFTRRVATCVFEKGFVDDDFLGAFAFTDIETVDDGRAFHVEMQQAEQIGTIEAEVHYATRTRISPRIDTKTNKGSADEEDKKDDVVSNIISEKAIKGKGLTHSVLFSDLEKSEPHNYNYEYVDPDEEPVAVFVFKYRSEAFLKSLLLIPRTPTPPPLEERTAEVLSLADIAELQRQLKAAKTQELARVKVKHEREQADDSPRPRKVARANFGDTQLDNDEKGEIRETSATNGTPVLREIIELD